VERLARQKRTLARNPLVLAFLLVRLSGFRLDSHRLPDGKAKSMVLCAVAA
jgi:hypothetical protein